MVQQLIAAAHHDTRIVGLVDYGSASEARGDHWSDVDVAVFVRDADFAAFAQQWKAWAAQFGTLLLAYVGGIGHAWTVYDAEPVPLRVDWNFSPAAKLHEMLDWPNAPVSTAAMVLYDGMDGQVTQIAQQLVGRSLHPPDLARAFEQVCGDFWYYLLRTWAKLQRDQLWAAWYDFNSIVIGNLLALLRLEANATDRWLASSAAVGIERVVSPERLAQLDACVAARSTESLRSALGSVARLGYDVSRSTARAHGWTWPQQFAERMLVVVEQVPS